MRTVSPIQTCEHGEVKVPARMYYAYCYTQEEYQFEARRSQAILYAMIAIVALFLIVAIVATIVL